MDNDSKLTEDSVSESGKIDENENENENENNNNQPTNDEGSEQKGQDVRSNTLEQKEKEKLTILERLDELQKQKRRNEYFIRVSQQTIKYRAQELEREIKKRYNRIKRIRQRNGKDMAEFDDLLEPIHYETIMATTVPVIEPTRYRLVRRRVRGELSTDEADEAEESEEDVTESEVEDIRAEVDKIKERISRDIENIRFEIEEKRIENLEIDRLMQNNWDSPNTATVTEWIKEGNKQNFIYERVREMLQKKVKRLTVAIMIMSGIQSLLSVSRFGVKEKDYPTVTFVFNIIVAVISTVVFIIGTYIKDSKFEDVIQSYTSYIEKLENFLSNLVSTADIKPELRPNGDIFVSEHRETYAQIYKDSPYISKGQWKTGMVDYKNYVLNADPEKELHCSRKRVNYAFFARQNTDNADIHSAWSGHNHNNYANPYENGDNMEYGTFNATRSVIRRVRKNTPSQDQQDNINESLKTANVESEQGSIGLLTGSTDGDNDNSVKINTKAKSMDEQVERKHKGHTKNERKNKRSNHNESRKEDVKDM